MTTPSNPMLKQQKLRTFLGSVSVTLYLLESIFPVIFNFVLSGSRHTFSMTHELMDESLLVKQLSCLFAIDNTVIVAS